MRIALTVNGERMETEIWEGESLLFALRERLGLPGSKNACEQGECGSCSVLLDGTLVCACLVLAAQADGHHVVTVEGLAQDGQLHRVQEAFAETGAVQCGFCTPGLIVAAADLLEREPDPSEDEIREALSGNLCRCTGYEDLRCRPPSRDQGRLMLPSNRLLQDSIGAKLTAEATRELPSNRLLQGSAAPQLELGRVGESVKRVDAIPKVTGEFAYASDLMAAGMLWGHTVRSPHAHARIVEIDISEALAMAGVHAVLTHADVPGAKTYGLEFADQPVLGIDRVRYFGEPVALVAAEHPEQARRAAEKIVVEYEPLEPVVDPERATEQEPIHDENPTAGHGFREDPRPNVLRSIIVRHGDPDAQGDVSVSGVYELGIQDQAFLGPESGLAVPDGEGGVDVYVATQWLHVDRDQVAPCLGLEKEQVRIHLAGVGGAFGGREDLSMQVHGALLALHTERPVKLVYSREESFVGHVHRHPAKIWMEHRATRAGKLVCVHARILLDGGAYASSSAAVTSNAAAFACGPYRVENALIESTCVYSNNPPCGAMRGSAPCRAASRTRRRWTSSPPSWGSTLSSCGY